MQLTSGLLRAGAVAVTALLTMGSVTATEASAAPGPSMVTDASPVAPTTSSQGTLTALPGATSSGDPAAAARNEAREQAAAASTPQTTGPAVAPTVAPPAPAVQVPSVEPVAPRRVLDTRASRGPTGGAPIAAGRSLALPVLGLGVPSAGVTAVLLNVTVVAGSTSGWVRVDDGTLSSATSDVNFLAGDVVANQVLVPVRAGAVRVLNGAASSAHVVVDVQGWVGAGAAMVAVPQARVLDTRRTGGTLRGGTSGTYKLAVPSGVRGVVANLLAVPVAGSPSGVLTAYASDATRPVVSNVNYLPGRASSTLSVIPVDDTGRVTVYNGGGNVDVVLDIEGYVTGGVTTERVYDSRRTVPTALPLKRGVVLRVPVAGVGTLPTALSGVMAHLTVTGSTSSGVLTSWASGSAMPATSSLNFLTGVTISNTIFLPVGADGSIALLTTAASTHVVVDIQSVVAAPEMPAVPLPSVPTLGPDAPGDTVAARQALVQATRYAMGPWWSDVAPGLLAAPSDHWMVTMGSAPNTDPIRRLAMTALSLSTALATGTYDADATGVGADVARQRVVTILTRIVSTHVATTPDGWGDSWQSTLWSGIAGRAAWMSWGDLPADVQLATFRMIEHEARYATTLPVTYYRDRNGVLVSAGNTFAEELSWRMLPLQVALVMFPGLPDRPVWQNAMTRLALSAWARPSDVRSLDQVNGAPLSAWVTGSNVEQDGVVVNHSRVAPDYSTNLYQNVDGALLFTLAGKPYPRALTALLTPVYTSLSTRVFSSPPFAAPGGTIYTGGPEIYYPQGIDWGTGQQLPFALVDSQAQTFLKVDTAVALEHHLAGQKALTDRFTDGRTYATPSEYVYTGREEHTAQLASQLVLTQLVRDAGTARTSNASAWLP